MSHQPIDVPFEGLLVLLLIGIDWNCLLHASLLPEERHWPSDLDMTKTLVFDEENLFGLAVVGYISFDINSSGIEAGSTFGPTPAGYQDIFYQGAYVK